MGKKGFSLIEVMLVVVIVGILAAVAIPSYNGYITRTRRADAVTALQTIALCEEKARAESGAYRDIATLSGTYGLRPVQTVGGVLCFTQSEYYLVTVPAPTADTFVAYAQPRGAQAGDIILAINQDGVGGTSATVGGTLIANPELWSSLRK